MGPQGLNKILGLVIAFFLVVGTIAYFRHQADRSPTLRVCTWSNYYPEGILTEFTEKTGIKVELSYISSNEELFAKLKAGASGFDIIQPSDYMIRQMAALQMLSPLDHAKIPNLSHIEDHYKALPYDPGLKFSVPFTWGTTGIAVNTGKVKLPAGDIGWEFLLNSPDPKRTSLLDDMREVFSAILVSQGKNPNTKSESDLNAAKTKITAVKDRLLMFTSEPKPLLLKGELTIAHVYSSDAIQAGLENPDIRFFIPKEGGIIWTDNFAIPTSSVRTEEAYRFINHFLDPDVAARVVRENHLATPNKTARLKLDPQIVNNPSLYPPQSILSKMVFMEDLGEALTTMNRLWTELKS